MADPVLSIDDLVVEFSTRRGVLRAVDAVSLTVRRGEVLGIVGESGAGKTLLGQAIIGLVDAPGRMTAGRIELNGRRIDNLPHDEMRRIRGAEIGVIIQDPLASLDPLMTIGSQIIETIRTHRNTSVAEAQEMAAELLRAVGIPAPDIFIGHYSHQFSGGMRQRVVIALALAAEPNLIIADEPTTALDMPVQAQVLRVLKDQCRRRGAAVMLITHDMGVIDEMADHVAVMYAGRLVEYGPKSDVLQHPRHPYTSGLLDCVPRLRPTAGRLRQIAGAMPRLHEIPRACAYSPRCSRRMKRCDIDRPALTGAGDHSAACWLESEPEDAKLDA